MTERPAKERTFPTEMKEVDFKDINVGKLIMPKAVPLPGQKIRVESLFTRDFFKPFEAVVESLEVDRSFIVKFNDEKYVWSNGKYWKRLSDELQVKIFQI